MKKMVCIIYILSIWATWVSAQGNEQLVSGLKAALSLRAYSDYVSVDQGHPDLIYVLSNDNGLSGGISSLEVTKEPKFGKAHVAEGHAIQYKSIPGYIGNDELWYKVCTKDGECDEAKVIVGVSDFDFKPVLKSDSVFLKPREIGEINVLTNDIDIFDTPINVSIVTDIENGYSAIDNEGFLTTNFDVSYRGLDSLKYMVSDQEGDFDEGWVYFQIKGDVGNDIVIPQGISPNGDGFNDVFKIPDLQGVPMQLKMFDAFGNLVMIDDKYQNNWNGIGNKGRYTGKLCNNGTYYYVLKVPDFNKEFTGFVYLNK